MSETYAYWTPNPEVIELSEIKWHGVFLLNKDGSVTYVGPGNQPVEEDEDSDAGPA